MAGFSLKERAGSFRHAFSGLGFVLRSQHNAWIHAVATVLAVVAGLALGLDGADWKWLVITIVVVWAAETMNTAFEHLCDAVSPAQHASVKLAKDIAAASVLICALGAVVMACLIFGPYVLAN